MPPRRYVLLDRDGTVIVECHYLSDPGQVGLVPGAARGLRELGRMGLGLVIVTNQSGLGRGLFDETCLARVHCRLRDLLSAEGVELDAIYTCPHVPEAGCRCRKPRPGLVEAAASRFGFRPEEAVVIGDKASDIELGRAIGATTLLVRTGYGAQTASLARDLADYTVDDLSEAARVVRALLVGDALQAASALPLSTPQADVPPGPAPRGAGGS